MSKEIVSFDLQWHFEHGTCKSLVIKDMKNSEGLSLTGTRFSTEDCESLDTTHYATFNTRGKTSVINIYKNKLPFDELVASINICNETGRVEDNRFVGSLDFSKIWMAFQKPKLVTPKWVKVGPDAYRISNEEGLLEVLDGFGLQRMHVAEVASNYSKLGGGSVLLTNNNRQVIVLTNITHPSWENDALWQ